MSKLASFASAAVVVAALSLPAQAATVALDPAPGPGPVINFGEVGLVTEAVTGSFTHSWFFQLPANTAHLEVTLSDLVNILPSFNFTVLNVDDLGATLGSLSPISVANSSTSQSAYYSGALGGAYMATVSGLATGMAGGLYSLSITPAIPEPQEWAMMLAGLGMVCVIAARRRRAGTAG